VGLARCGIVFPVSVVVGAAVPAALCCWGLCPHCPGVGRCLSGVSVSSIIMHATFQVGSYLLHSSTSIQCAFNEHGNVSVFYRTVEPNSLIAFFGTLVLLRQMILFSLIIYPETIERIQMTKSAEQPRSGNRAQQHCKKRNRCRVHKIQSVVTSLG